MRCIKHRSRSPTGGPFKPGFGFPPEPEESARARTTVVDALDKYSEYIRYHRSLLTFRTYGPILAGFDASRIINPLAGRNQIEGAVVMGIGMALFEHTTYDPQNGAPINSSLADYVMTVNADVPPIDVHFLDFPDKEINELGARGIGEIGLTGIDAAITAAVHHATGVRVRELPVKIEDLLG